MIAGSSSKKGVDEYLTLLTVAETCDYQELGFLDFLRSRERDVETFARGRRRYHSHKTVGNLPQRPTQESSASGDDQPVSEKIVDLRDDVS